MIDEKLNKEKWSENVIIADADYVDQVAFDLIVNFERMIGRRIPQADMARWIDCVALDGGLREGSQETQVVLIHSKKRTAMDNFSPSDACSEIKDISTYVCQMAGGNGCARDIIEQVLRAQGKWMADNKAFGW